MRKSRLHATARNAYRDFVTPSANNRDTVFSGRDTIEPLNSVISSTAKFRSCVKKRERERESFMANSNAASLTSPLTCERIYVPVFHFATCSSVSG